MNRSVRSVCGDEQARTSRAENQLNNGDRLWELQIATANGQQENHNRTGKHDHAHQGQLCYHLVIQVAKKIKDSVHVASARNLYDIGE